MANDSPTDRAQAPSSLPEPFIGDLDPYLVHSRVEILANLRVLIDQQIAATVYFNQAANFFVTRLLGSNPEFEELIFDLAPDRRTNEMLQAASGLTVVAFLDHIKVQFTGNRAEFTQFQGAPAFRMRIPRSLVRLQRRSAFRARTQALQSPHLLLSPTADKFGKVDTARVRVIDISATGLAISMPLGRPVLTAGMHLPGCQLELKAGDAFDVDIEVRHLAVFKDGFGREMGRAGCRMQRLTATAETAIQHYVSELAAAGPPKA